MTAWNERDLSHTRYPFVLVDALVIKVREDGRVRSCSALLATAPNASLRQRVSSGAPKAVQEELHARVRAIFEAPDIETARTLLAKVVADYEQQAPTAIATLERGFDDATAVLALPRPYRKRLRTTNGQERLNEEVRRRERVIRIFPNRQSAIRLLGALLMEQDEAWSTGKRYFDMTAYWQWRDAKPLSVPEGGASQTV